jgi:single-stranded DNA-binding protein
MWGKNNNIQLSGMIVGDIIPSHEIYDESFYNFTLKVNRLSGNYDELPITISGRFIEKLQNISSKSKYIGIVGQIRSYNSYKLEDKRTKLILSVFVQYVNSINLNQNNSDQNDLENKNQVYLNGYVCKEPTHRVTPFGREITDILVAINRSYRKSDYIPCIAWGEEARFASELKTGDSIELTGRMQSRQYQKKLETGETIEKTTYEVSISEIKKREGQRLI